MKRLFVAAVLFGLFASSVAASRVVWYPDDLSRAGVGRIGDVQRLLDGWDVTTIDGFTWTASPMGLSAYDASEWRVLINSQPIDLNMFGTTTLNRLPISIADVDSIEVITVPKLVVGSLAAGGAIHIHTRTGTEKLSANGRLFTGNETGDPGPYLFTEFATPNIDRSGPDVSGDVNIAHRGHSVRLGAARRRHYVTDTAVSARNNQLAGDEDPSLHMIGGFAEARSRALGGNHVFFSGYSEFDDFFFLKPFGREVPVTSRLMHTGISGLVPFGNLTRVVYHAAYSSTRIGKRANTAELDLDWKHTESSGSLSWMREQDAYDVTVGGGVARANASSSYALREDRTNITRLFVDWRHRVGRSTTYNATIVGVHSDGDLSGRGRIAATLNLEKRHTIEGSIAYLERLPEEDSRLWYWQERGYDFLADQGTTVSRDRLLARTYTITGDARWSFALTGAVSVEAKAFVRSFSKQQLEQQVYQFDSAEQTFAGPIELVSNQSGRVYGIHMGTTLALREDIVTKTRYRYQDTNGDQLFESVWRSVPQHRFQQLVDYGPVPGFRVRARFDYWGATQWDDFVDVEIQSQGQIKSSIDAVTTFGFDIEKLFWQRNLLARLGFDNVFSETVRYHPAGASFTLGVTLEIELGLDLLTR